MTDVLKLVQLQKEHLNFYFILIFFFFFEVHGICLLIIYKKYELCVQKWNAKIFI